MGNKKVACKAPKLGKKVYKYQAGALNKEDTKKFLDHVSNCPKCERTLRRLDWIAKTLSENREEFFTPEELGPERYPYYIKALREYLQRKSVARRDISSRVMVRVIENRVNKNRLTNDGEYSSQQGAEDLADFLLMARYGEIPREHEKFRGKQVRERK